MASSVILSDESHRRHYSFHSLTMKSDHDVKLSFKIAPKPKHVSDRNINIQVWITKWQHTDKVQDWSRAICTSSHQSSRLYMSLSCYFPPLPWAEIHYLHCSNRVKGLLMHPDVASVRPLNVSEGSLYCETQHLDRDTYVSNRRRGTWLRWLIVREPRSLNSFLMLLLNSRIMLRTEILEFHTRKNHCIY